MRRKPPAYGRSCSSPETAWPKSTLSSRSTYGNKRLKPQSKLRPASSPFGSGSTRRYWSGEARLGRRWSGRRRTRCSRSRVGVLPHGAGQGGTEQEDTGGDRWGGGPLEWTPEDTLLKIPGRRWLSDTVGGDRLGRHWRGQVGGGPENNKSSCRRSYWHSVTSVGTMIPRFRVDLLFLRSVQVRASVSALQACAHAQARLHDPPNVLFCVRPPKWPSSYHGGRCRGFLYGGRCRPPKWPSPPWPPPK